MVQTATPTSTNSNDWTVTGSGTAHEALASASDSSLIETATQGDICNVSIGSLTDPAVSTGHIIRFRAQATGSGGPERVQVKLYNSTTQRAVSGNIAVTRGSFNAFSYTLDATDYAVSTGEFVMSRNDTSDSFYVLRNNSGATDTTVNTTVVPDEVFRTHRLSIDSVASKVWLDRDFEAVNTSDLPTGKCEPFFRVRTRATGAKEGRIRYMEAYNT